MSRYTRVASTDKQEDSIKKVEKWCEKAGLKIVGGTTIGKHPQTVILDFSHHGSNVYVYSDGRIESGLNDIVLTDYEDFKREISNEFPDVWNVRGSLR